ncbi:MAG: TIGR02147 family protein [Deltaproteobacteria bacterium]|nr:TIGR02147 family protein [Deltaproteobacteria bacterium]
MAELDVSSYKDYRKLLTDYYYAQKKRRSSYSYKAFAQKAGLNSPNYLKLVMDGKRNLSHKNIKKFAKGLGLDRYSSEYFENLVYLNQAGEDELRNFYKGRISLLNRGPVAKKIDEEQKKICDKWYFWVVREMIHLQDFNADADWIVRQLKKKISKEEALEALETLRDIGLLIREDNRFKASSKSIVMGDEIEMKKEAITAFHKEMAGQALDHLKSDNYQQREFNGVTVAISKKNMGLIKERIREFRREINQFLSSEENPDAIYQLNIQFFPLTERQVYEN